MSSHRGEISIFCVFLNRTGPTEYTQMCLCTAPRWSHSLSTVCELQTCNDIQSAKSYGDVQHQQSQNYTPYNRINQSITNTVINKLNKRLNEEQRELPFGTLHETFAWNFLQKAKTYSWKYICPWLVQNRKPSTPLHSCTWVMFAFFFFFNVKHMFYLNLFTLVDVISCQMIHEVIYLFPEFYYNILLFFIIFASAEQSFYYYY